LEKKSGNSRYLATITHGNIFKGNPAKTYQFKYREKASLGRNPGFDPQYIPVMTGKYTYIHVVPTQVALTMLITTIN
jgi:hypothetical protein